MAGYDRYRRTYRDTAAQRCAGSADGSSVQAGRNRRGRPDAKPDAYAKPDTDTESDTDTGACVLRIGRVDVEQSDVREPERIDERFGSSVLRHGYVHGDGVRNAHVRGIKREHDGNAVECSGYVPEALYGVRSGVSGGGYGGV